MTRLFATATAALAMLGATPALAQGPYYSATPKAQLTKTSMITRSTVWKCADGTCSANRGGERDAIMCELVVQRAGELSAFSAGGTPFGDDALAKCNARAK